ncbi:hypothetical protein DFJ73DRAFT_926160 [Zopfochytrium polystomum]|nr:hypothetical protein DFJ73DRAFT_926160 [Zopfochytrium polystomum]
MTPASTFGQYGNLNNKGDADAIAGWFAIVSDRVMGELVALANGFVGDNQTGLKWISEKHLARCRQWGDVPTSLWSRRSNKQDNRQCNCHCPKAKLLEQLLQLCVISGARTLGHLVGRGSGGDFRMGNLTVKNRLTLRGTDPPPSLKLPLLAIPTQTVTPFPSREKMYLFGIERQSMIRNNSAGSQLEPKIMNTAGDQVDTILKLDNLQGANFLDLGQVAFGAYATCTFAYQLEKKEDVLEIQGKLQAALNVLIASLDLTGQGEYANKDLSFFEKTTLLLEGTFLSQQSVPSNPNEMIRFFRSIPNLFNYENHVAYELTPVDSIRKPVARYLLLKNEFANTLFAKRLDLDDAISRSSEAIVAIPGRFSASGYGRLVDGKMQEEPTSVNPAQSKTLIFCQMYTIHLHNRDIVFIDCPGIVDGRGIEKDQENLQHIMSFISPLGYLNAIFFIMKPNEERLSSTFAYTVIESCSRLSKECKENIFILFTTSSTTNFRLGGTRDTLAKLQSKVSPDGRLDLLDDERHFFFDNSALRLVYAKTNERELYPDPNGSLFESNRTAWAYSKAASVRLTTALLNLPTVRTDGLDTLTDTKALVQNVASFLVHVTSAIENTVRSLQRQQDEIRRMEKEKIALDKQLKVKYTFVKHVQLDLPMTPCYLSNLPLNQVNPPGMINCNAFLNAANGKCHSCKARGKDCDYTLHMHMTSDVEFQDKEMILPEIQQQQDEKVNSINAYKSRIAALAAKEKQLEHEKELIIRQIARLAQFVLDNSLVPPSDEILRYFRMEIQTLESYPDRDKELRILREAIRMRPAQSGDESGTSTVKSTDEVKTIITNLCNMKEFGRNIKECIEALEEQRQAAATVPPGGSAEARFFDLNTNALAEARLSRASTPPNPSPESLGATRRLAHPDYPDKQLSSPPLTPEDALPAANPQNKSDPTYFYVMLFGPPQDPSADPTGISKTARGLRLSALEPPPVSSFNTHYGNTTRREQQEQTTDGAEDAPVAALTRLVEFAEVGDTVFEEAAYDNDEDDDVALQNAAISKAALEFAGNLPQDLRECSGTPGRLAVSGGRIP